jgi:oligopeptide transport system substrate-binding protein
MTGMLRNGWQMDYPSIQNFLEPLYATGVGSNDGLYSNKKFDALISQGDAASGSGALTRYQQAEAQLAQTMPVIPLWYEMEQVGWSSGDQCVVEPLGDSGPG